MNILNSNAAYEEELYIEWAGKRARSSIFLWELQPWFEWYWGMLCVAWVIACCKYLHFCDKFIRISLFKRSNSGHKFYGVEKSKSFKAFNCIWTDLMSRIFQKVDILYIDCTYANSLLLQNQNIYLDIRLISPCIDWY